MTINSPGGEKFSRHVVEGGDGAGLLDLLSRSRAKAEQRYGVPIRAIVIQEAGLDGFWIHRLLLAEGIESHVVDAASIAVDRRHRRAKTDAIDGETLLRTLMAWARGERRVCSMVRAPSPEEEDRRRLTRERGTLRRRAGERTPHPPDRQRRPGSANNRQGVGAALIQLVRIESAQAAAAEAIAAGDLGAIGPYLKVLDQLDRYHKAGATKDVYDDVARERLLSKINRIAARLEAGKGRKAAKEAADLAGGAGEA